MRDELRTALAAVLTRDGAHPFVELECGRMTEARFLTSLEQMLGQQVGRAISCADFSEMLWAGWSPTSR